MANRPHMFDLLKEMFDCTEFVIKNVRISLGEIVETWERCSTMYAGIVEKLNVTWRAPLDADFLEKFPNIRNNVAKKLEWNGNRQISILIKLIGRLLKLNECLKIKLNSINNRLKQTSLEDHSELNSYTYEHIMWIENCWSCLHCLYMKLDFAMASIKVSDEESAYNLIGAIKLSEKDKFIIDQSVNYIQSCLALMKYLENKNKVKITS